MEESADPDTGIPNTLPDDGQETEPASDLPQEEASSSGGSDVSIVIE